MSAPGGGDGAEAGFTVTLTKLLRNSEPPIAQTKFTKGTRVKDIKDRMLGEFDVPLHEQLVLFRGRPIAKPGMTEEEEQLQPMASPELADIIEEAGEDGLRMAVIHQPFLVPKFLKLHKTKDVNFLMPTGATMLHRAVRLCELPVVKEILERKDFTGIDALDSGGQTSLHAACTCCYRECALALLGCPEFSAVAVPDSEGRTALHLAAWWGDATVCEAILRHEKFTREDMERRSDEGHTAFELARDCGHNEVVDVFQKFMESQQEMTVPGELKR